MWRPLLFRRPYRVGCLCRLQPLRERIDARPQGLDFLALLIDDIAQFDVGALQEGQFRLQPLDCIAVHFDSVTVIRAGRVPRAAAATIETKLEVFLYPWPAGNAVSSVDCAVRCSRNAYFSRSAAHIKHCNQTSSVAAERRVYLPRLGD